MSITTRDELLEALRDGIRSDDFARFAKSKGSLKVRIHNLRREGFPIVSISQPDQHARVMYRLMPEGVDAAG